MSEAATVAMVLAAGEGRRLRPFRLQTPNPLLPLAGRTLLDRGLDGLVAAGVTRAVINVHHLGQQIIDHLARRDDIAIVISDERNMLRDSAGALVHARPHLGDGPVVVLNADTFWIEDNGGQAIRTLVEGFDPSRMDLRLLMVDQNRTTGHAGHGDFVIDPDGRLWRAAGPDRETAPIYAGCLVLMPELFDGAPDTPHSLNLYFDGAIARERLYGMRLDGHWVTVGTPDAIAPAERACERLARQPG